MAAEAYWTSIDVKSVGAAGVAITGIAFPFLRDMYREWRAGRVMDSQSLAKVAETAAERQDRINREQYDRIEADREYHANLAQRNATALAVCESQTAIARQESLGMERWAHWYRHGWVNMHQQFVDLLRLADRVLKGEITAERARVNYDQVLATLPPEPMDVPLLQETITQRPPRG